jgi:hypothetical protein
MIRDGGEMVDELISEKFAVNIYYQWFVRC